ncbi:MAG: fused MFS/spermidine synthase [Planctomycetaceae bacterium]|jgi:spermidine synthase|nr:fused MFS/spermidine synthase [Planctomycetaceae bacterium]
MRSGILILSNAFLLFLIQPILGKALLPKWGATAHVWTTCLLFFQTALLVGYFYASQTHKKLNLQSQATLHASLWGLSAIAIPALAWWPSQTLPLANFPTLAILLELLLRIGLAFVLMASTSSLISAWHFRSTQSHHPYAWYALSNLTSLASCLLYPLAIEPWWSLPTQLLLWTILYWILALAMITYSLSIRNKASSIETLPIRPQNAIGQLRWPLLLGLSACSSIVLSTATSHASQAGLIVPGLWVLPLAVYLATWWLAFSSKLFESWAVQTSLFYVGALLGIGIVAFKLWLPWIALVGCCLGCVASIGLACHGLIYRLRPDPDLMPAFYLQIALGGALGSLFATVLAPWLFSDYYELHAALALGAIWIAWYHARAMSQKLLYDPFTRRIAWPLTILCPTILLGALSMLLLTPSLETLIDQKRDFYGVVSVIENSKQSLRAMLHGRIRHGTQPIHGPLDPDQTTYYQTDSGAALAFGWCHNQSKQPLRVAVIGLGTGSLSLYAKAQDSLRYYEISPAVCEMAKKHFGYLAAHTGSTEIRVGDGRRLLEQESLSDNELSYDLMFVDAFANDSLPIHLLTLEALELYKKRLAPNGILAINITNRNLVLAPILFATSKRAGFKPLLVESKLATYEPVSRKVRWLVLFPQNSELPAWPGARDKLAPSQDPSSDPSTPQSTLWTDQFASPLHAIRW